MTKFIELVEQKNAEGFRSAVEGKLAEKVADVLDGLKPVIAQKFFSQIGEDAQGAPNMSDKTCNTGNESEPGPGKGQAPDAKGGFAQAQSKAKKMPGAGASQGMPGK